MNSNAKQAASTQRIQPDASEEPIPTQEEDVPLDGRDEVGEKMIEDLARDRAAQQRT